MNFEEILRKYKIITLESVHTLIPGTIESFDGVKMEATVVPLAKIKIGETEVEPQPIERCPVIFPNDSTFSIRHPLQKGDNILIGFSEVSLENILKTKNSTSAISKEKFNISDAIVIGGMDGEFDKLPAADLDGLLIINKKTGHKIVFKADGSLETTCEIINAPLATITCKQLIATEKITSPLGEIIKLLATTEVVSPSMKIAGKEMANHKHTNGTASDGNTGINI